MKAVLAILLIALVTASGCTKTDSTNFTTSSASVIINERLYDEAKNQSTEYKITDARIVRDSLVLTIGVPTPSVDFNDRVSNLLSSGMVAESFPVQMWLRLYISQHNNDDLGSYMKDYRVSFSLVPLRQRESSKISLHLDGWKEGLLYEY